jgi:hypothetical protein
MWFLWSFNANHHIRAYTPRHIHTYCIHIHIYDILYTHTYMWHYVHMTLCVHTQEGDFIYIYIYIYTIYSGGRFWSGFGTFRRMLGVDAQGAWSGIYVWHCAIICMTLCFSFNRTYISHIYARIFGVDAQGAWSGIYVWHCAIILQAPVCCSFNRTYISHIYARMFGIDAQGAWSGMLLIQSYIYIMHICVPGFEALVLRRAKKLRQAGRFSTVLSTSLLPGNCWKPLRLSQLFCNSQYLCSVCMNVCMYVCMRVWEDKHERGLDCSVCRKKCMGLMQRKRTWTGCFFFMCVYIYIYIYICRCTHACVGICFLFMCVYIYIYIYIGAHMHA